MAEDPGRTLVLFRHAKSAWPDVPDHDRPLARRGIRAAPVMGRWLREAGLVPGQVLCSTARRARETWHFAQAGLAASPPVTFDVRIYAAAPADLLALIREAPPATGTLLLTAASGAAGPGTAGPRTGGSHHSDLDRMRSKFPTAAIAVLRSGGTWHDLAPGRARLTAFVTPGDLGAERAQG